MLVLHSHSALRSGDCLARDWFPLPKVKRFLFLISLGLVLGEVISVRF